METLIPLWSAAASLVGGLLVWLLADTRSKARLQFLEEKVQAAKLAADIPLLDLTTRSHALECQIARSDQDRLELHRGLDRLEQSKASKDVLDLLKTDLERLEALMEKRFDRLERIIENRAPTP